MKLESFREDWPVTWAEHEIVELREGAKMSFRAKMEWLEETLAFAKRLQECPRSTASGEPLPPLRYPLASSRYEREVDSVPCPFYVCRNICITCGLPPETAPQNVSWSVEKCGNGADHCRVAKQPETPEELKKMIEAACGSCVEAIRYCGTDPEIIAKFMERGMGHLCDAIIPQS